ncbi:hypothetical protein LXA43DRAFT_879998 [Ganoderma leucocontextum]|nr:hypothetical protein LXA43DRAFT_879998 [Ganoderma leucocontextum]
MEDNVEKTWTAGVLPKPRGPLVNNKATSGLQPEDGRHIPRRTRTYSHSTRNPLIHRLDTWLFSVLPTTLRSSIPTLALLYCLLSIWFFSGYISSGSLSRPPSPTLPQQEIFEISALERLPLDHLLSKVSSLRPLTLDPDVLGARVDRSPFCACVWATEEEMDLIVPWAEKWTGPMSLLITTTSTPDSSQHRTMLSMLAKVQSKSPLLRKTLSAHVLHIDPSLETRPNAFLNLARLLSPCPRAVLFPGNLSYAPPKNLYKTLIGQQTTSSSAMAGRIRKRKPVVLTIREHISFPFAPLAPLLISRDDSTWCTERFFTNVSRSADWEECIWQVWLAHLGDVEAKQLQGWTPAVPDRSNAWQSEHPAMVRMPALSSALHWTQTYVQEKIHRRLAAKFRGETCALAIRRFTALRDPGNTVDTKRARWLKRVCRGWTPG